MIKFYQSLGYADDVVFSATRVRHPDSDLRVRLSADTQVVKVDDHTVDFITKAPNPILHVEWDTWYIMSKTWTEKHNAALLSGQVDTAYPVPAFHNWFPISTHSINSGVLRIQ